MAPEGGRHGRTPHLFTDTLHDSPKRLSRAPKGPPRKPQEGPKMTPTRPKELQEGPKMPQKSPERIPTLKASDAPR